MWTGTALGLGLLTKAYFLAAVPALAILYCLLYWRAKEKLAVLRGVALAAGSSITIAGWWYVHNRIATGTWTGLSESVILVHRTPGQYLAGLMHVPWGRAIDAVLLSHIWFGGWSSLGLRSWMYHVFYVVIAVSLAGVVRELWKPRQFARASLLPLVVIYGCFWVAELYNVLLIFLSKGVATSMGWYVYSVVCAEAALLVTGLAAFVRGRRRLLILSALIVCVAAMDLYSVHIVSIPYYAGLTAHRPNHSVASFHFGQLRQVGPFEIFERLSENKPAWLTPFALEAAWIGYATATLLLAGLPLALLKKDAVQRADAA